MSKQKNHTSNGALTIFRVGSVAATALAILEGVAGPAINSHLPSLVPFGGTPLAEFGLVMGITYCVAEIVSNRNLPKR
jgi:hypothetical protein